MSHRRTFINLSQDVDWHACDDIGEEVNGHFLSLELAVNEEDLTGIASIGLVALSEEVWLDSHSFKNEANDCRNIWMNALDSYEKIIGYRQQG